MKPGMRRVIAVLNEHGPLSKAQIMRLAFVASRTFDPYVRVMLADGHAHIKEYIRKGSGLPKAVFAFGPGPNAERPATLSYEVSITAPGVQRARKAIEAAATELAPRELCKAANISLNYFINDVRKLLIDHKLMHQSGWRRNTRGTFIPLYSPGPGNGKPPRRMKKSVPRLRCRAWKERTGYNERRRIENRVKRAPSLLAALLGA